MKPEPSSLPGAVWENYVGSISRYVVSPSIVFVGGDNCTVYSVGRETIHFRASFELGGKCYQVTNGCPVADGREDV